MNGKRIFRLICIILLALVLVGGGLCATAKWHAYWTRKDAEILVSDIHNLRVGESTTQEVRSVARQHDRYRIYLAGDTPNCPDAGETCYFDFLYQNSLLAYFHLAPPTEFGARIQTVRGRVDVVLMGIGSGSGPEFLSASVTDGVPNELLAPDSFRVSVASNWRGAVLVRMTRNVSASLRDRAYSLGLICLDRIGGCHSKDELLPALGTELAVH
jgi:hypothetical protein